MTVTPTYDVSAPFFVYTNVTDWYEINLPASVKTIKDIEDFVSERTKEAKRPFAFKLEKLVVVFFPSSNYCVIKGYFLC